MTPARSGDPPLEVVCPRCRCALRSIDDAVLCTGCGARFPIVDDVIDFLAQPEQNDARDGRERSEDVDD